MKRVTAVSMAALWLAACQTTAVVPPSVDANLVPNRVAITSGDGTRISGYLFRPDTEEARPAILMLHGCSGLLTKSGKLKSREQAWRDIFIAEGYVVLLLDSFTERGHRSICKIDLANRPVEPDRERPHDAYGALRWLQSKAFVRPERVTLAGWSNGAMAMLWTVFSEANQRPASLKYDFHSAFGFYPGCITLRKRQPRYTAAIPTLLQIGADDNWTLPAPCKELVEVANASGGAQMSFDAYEGAVHSFDYPNSKRRTISVSNGRRVEIGTDPIARQKAIERIKTYLRRGFSG